ncbi:hypothetical protein HNP77_001056 [Treponema rectale]|uniref:Uncharacterized protein n=1 Tax=Treponema rectale TaxID=744512 RepID=A0A840SAF0_9SPIR|nr:hypothetical protein [Treponema rectale]MBB5218687.1 hypothetical protein [Treponema rectale]
MFTLIIVILLLYGLNSWCCEEEFEYREREAERRHRERMRLLKKRMKKNQAAKKRRKTTRYIIRDEYGRILGKEVVEE